MRVLILSLLLAVQGPSNPETVYPFRAADPDASPRIAQLREAVQKGSSNAVEMFWSEMRQHTRDPAQTVIGGASLGGLASTFTAINHPKVFGKVLSQSGSYWWPDIDKDGEWLTRKVAELPRQPIEFFLEVGRMEGADVLVEYESPHARHTDRQGLPSPLPGIQHQSQLHQLARRLWRSAHEIPGQVDI